MQNSVFDLHVAAIKMVHLKNPIFAYANGRAEPPMATTHAQLGCNGTCLEKKRAFWAGGCGLIHFYQQYFQLLNEQINTLKAPHEVVKIFSPRKVKASQYQELT